MLSNIVQNSVWIFQNAFLIIICSIFVQSSDWLVATAISHYYLLNFRSKLWLASQQMTWPKFILKSCKRLRELSPEHDSSLLTQLSFCDINKGPWYKFSLCIRRSQILEQLQLLCQVFALWFYNFQQIGFTLQTFYNACYIA